MEEAQFKCLRCGHVYKDLFDKTAIVERACPKCSSNSVRRQKKPESPNQNSTAS